VVVLGPAERADVEAFAIPMLARLAGASDVPVDADVFLGLGVDDGLAALDGPLRGPVMAFIRGSGRG
jgi:hypothetical protein